MLACGLSSYFPFQLLRMDSFVCKHVHDAATVLLKHRLRPLRLLQVDDSWLTIHWNKLDYLETNGLQPFYAQYRSGYKAARPAATPKVGCFTYMKHDDEATSCEHVRRHAVVNFTP